jgi:hypothetical protein
MFRVCWRLCLTLSSSAALFVPLSDPRHRVNTVSACSAVLARATCAWLIFMPIATFVLYHILLVILRPILASQQKTTA